MRPERGFINRKVARLNQEKGMRENTLQSLDLCIENLLDRAMKLAKKRKRARKQLDKLVENLAKLQPRLKCENKSLALASCKVEIPNCRNNGIEDMF